MFRVVQSRSEPFACLRTLTKAMNSTELKVAVYLVHFIFSRANIQKMHTCAEPQAFLCACTIFLAAGRF